MPDSRGRNVLVDYLDTLLADHVEWEEGIRAGQYTWNDVQAGIAERLPDILAKEYEPELKKALAKNAELPKVERRSAEEVQVGVRLLLEGKAQRAWENANWEKAQAAGAPTNEPFPTPFAVAVSYLVRWIDVPGINEEKLRVHLAGLYWGGPTERDPLVAELERLDEESFAYKLAEIIKEQCPIGAARIKKHPDCDSVSHSPDFRSVRWFGQSYSFTPNQAACVKMLWEAWERGTPEVGGQTLLDAADASTERIDVVFRGCSAWNTMIVSGNTKGAYQLAKPTAEAPKTHPKKSSQRARK